MGKPLPGVVGRRTGSRLPGRATALRGAAAALIGILLIGPACSAIAADEAGADEAGDDELPFGRAAVRDLVVGRLSEMAGRELEVTGGIDIDLAWTPSMRLEGVRVANADWARAPHLMEIEALEIELDMRALLDGDVLLPRLSLIRPTLFLEVSEDGDANWVLGGDRQTVVESAAAPGGKPGNLPRIDRLEVTGGELAYLDHRDADAQWTRGQIGEAGGSLDDDGVDIGVSGRLGGDAYSVVLRTASLDALRAGSDPNPVFLLATSGGSRLMVEGTVIAPFALRGIDLALEAHAGGFHRLPLLAGLPESPPFALDARLRRDAGPWRLSQLMATIGRSAMRGEVALDPTGERPRITADLTAETLVIDELLALAPDNASPAARPASSVSDRAIDLSALAALDADIEAEAQRLEYGRWHLNEAQLHLLIDDGVLRLSPLSAAVGDGRVAADLTLTTRPVAAQARIEIDALDLNDAFEVDGEGAGEMLGVLEGNLLVALPPSDRHGNDAVEPVLHPAPALERLRVHQGRLSYRQPDNDTDLRLRIASNDGDARPEIGAEGRFRGYQLEATVGADPLPALLRDARYAAEGRFQLGDANARFDAVLLAPPELTQLRVDFNAGGGLTPLGDLLGRELPPHGQLAGELRRDGAAWTLSDLQALLGDSDLSGRVALDTSGERPAVDVDLRSQTLDLAGLLPEGQGRADAGAGTRKGTGSALDLLSNLDGELDYQSDRILLETAEIADLDLRVVLDNGRMRLGPLQLDYRRPEQQTALAVRLGDAPARQGLRGDVDGRLRGESIAATLRTDGWVDLGAGGASGRWELVANPGESRVALAGDLRDLLTPARLRMRLSARGPNAAQLSDLVALSLPRTPPFEVDLALRRTDGRFILDEIDARLGDSDIDGRIAIDPDNVPTAVDVDLTSDRLDLDDLLALLDQRPGVEPEKLFTDRPLGLAELGSSLQGRLRYRAAEVVAARIPLSDVALDARLREGRLHLEPLRIGAGGGDLRLTLDLDTAADPPTADLDGRVRRIDLRRALDAYEIADDSLGTVGGELRLWMQGQSAAQLAGSADGGLFLLMTEGVFEQLLVEAAGLDVGEAALALLDGDRVPVDCGYLNLHARDGQVEVETLAVDTRDTLFVGGGEIDLDRQWLELVVEARAKDRSLPAFGSPLTLSGPLKDPELKLVSAELVGRTIAAVTLAAAQPFAALLPLIEAGGGSGSPYCDGLMERLQEGYR